MSKSMAESILKVAIENIMQHFIQEVSEKFDIDNTKLLEIWNGSDTQKCGSVSSVLDMSDLSETDPDKLIKLTRPELQALCRKKGVKCSGNKAQLVANILGNDVQVQSAPAKKNTTVKKAAKQTPQVLKTLSTKAPTVPIMRNAFDNYEHPETSLVFNRDKKVFGKQNEDGTVSQLTPDDIDMCNKYKFDYVLPENLDTGLNEVEVEELEEVISDIEEEDDEVVEEEEEFEEEELLESDFEEEEFSE